MAKTIKYAVRTVFYIGAFLSLVLVPQVIAQVLGATADFA